MTSIVAERVKQGFAWAVIALGGLSVGTYIANTETAPVVAHVFEHFPLFPERAIYDALPPDRQAQEDARFTTDVSENRTAYLVLAGLLVIPSGVEIKRSRERVKVERARRNHPEWFTD